jgi:hypothetical protein
VWKWILAHIWYALGSTPGTGCDTEGVGGSYPHDAAALGQLFHKPRKVADISVLAVAEVRDERTGPPVIEADRRGAREIVGAAKWAPHVSEKGRKERAQRSCRGGPTC